MEINVAKELAALARLTIADLRARYPCRAPRGRKPGLYKDGAEGSLAGLLVYDPAKGKPVVPEGKLASFGLLIVCGPEYVEPPVEVV